MFLGHLTCIIYFHLFNPLCFPCPSLGVISLQENGKAFSVSSTIRIPVERKDNGAPMSCEASHPALSGQKRVRHYRLDVYCKCVCMCVRFHPSFKQIKYHNVRCQIFQNKHYFICMAVTEIATSVLFITVFYFNASNNFVRVAASFFKWWYLIFEWSSFIHSPGF